MPTVGLLKHDETKQYDGNGLSKVTITELN